MGSRGEQLPPTQKKKILVNSPISIDLALGIPELGYRRLAHVGLRGRKPIQALGPITDGSGGHFLRDYEMLLGHYVRVPDTNQLEPT